MRWREQALAVCVKFSNMADVEVNEAQKNTTEGEAPSSNEENLLREDEDVEEDPRRMPNLWKAIEGLQ